MNNVLNGRVDSLDGLRAVAVMSVMAVHCGLPGFQTGWVGVDLFFALSGFLITSLLLSEYDRSGTISAQHFFARRFLRLMPAYLFYIAGITVAMWFWAGSLLNTHGGWSPELYTISLWAYFVNFAPMGGIWNGQGITLHLWSLAVEEQYYLIWPLIVIFFLKSRYLLFIAWCGAFITTALFVGVVDDFSRGVMLYARGMSIFIASALAVSLWWSPTSKRLVINLASSNFIFVFTLIVIILSFAVGATNVLSETQVRHYFLPWLSCGFALIVVRCAVTDAWVPDFLIHPWLIQIGKISYGIYLYHELTRTSVWYITSQLFSDFPRYIAFGIKFILFFLLTLLLSAMSYRFLELPFLRLKDRFRR